LTIPSPNVVHGVVVVVRRQGKLLMIRRAEHVIAPGAWCFVGGAIEPNETQPDAVAREFCEEVGAVVRPLRKIWESTRPDGLLVLHWWLAEMDADAALRPNPAEVAEVRWLTTAEIDTLPGLLESNRQFLAASAPASHLKNTADTADTAVPPSVRPSVPPGGARL
jgi:8-oxo-dGTP pyrophosphatase MutT (NUDIX family)